MSKYLFTDGINGVKEAQSQEELQALIASAPRPELVRIWLFNTNEWVSYKGFTNGSNLNNKQTTALAKKNGTALTVVERPVIPTPAKRKWIKKVLLFLVAGTGIFLIYNFTRIKWEKAAALNITAARPANVPLVDVDSLLQYLEDTRGVLLDKVTKTNLRIRNTWPDRITLQLNTDRDVSSAGSRYYNTELSIDNSTGYNIDNAVVKFTVWKNSEASISDTFHFNNISYAAAAKRKLENTYHGDSISISFQSIKAKAFNFCYSDDKKSNYGNNNDRWFCR